MADDDKQQLGLSDQARDDLDYIVQEARFKERLDAYRLSITAALAKELAPAEAGLRRVTYINVGGLDPDGQLRSAIAELREGDRPYSLAERLAEAGIADLARHLRAGKSLRDYLAELQPASSAEPTPASAQT